MVTKVSPESSLTIQAEEPAVLPAAKPDMRTTANKAAVIHQGSHRDGEYVFVPPSHSSSAILLKSHPPISCLPTTTDQDVVHIAPHPSPSHAPSPPRALVTSMKSHPPVCRFSATTAQDVTPVYLASHPLPTHAPPLPSPQARSVKSHPPVGLLLESASQEDEAPDLATPPLSPSSRVPTPLNSFSPLTLTSSAKEKASKEAITKAKELATQLRQWAIAVEKLSTEPFVASRVREDFLKATSDIEIIEKHFHTATDALKEVTFDTKDETPKKDAFAIARFTLSSIKADWFEVSHETLSILAGRGSEECYKGKLKKLSQTMEGAAEIFTKAAPIFDTATHPSVVDKLLQELHSLRHSPIFKTETASATPELTSPQPRAKRLKVNRQIAQSDQFANNLPSLGSVDNALRIGTSTPAKSTWDKVWNVCYAYKGCENGWVIFKVVMVVLSLITFFLLPLTLWAMSKLYDCCLRGRGVERM